MKQFDSRYIIKYGTSNDVKVYADGTARLTNGSCRVNFAGDFSQVISSSGNPTITVTPYGACNGVYIAEIDKTGFIVREQNSGNSSVDFSWIAIATRRDAETVGKLPELLRDKNFDDSMKKVMFNESNTDSDASPFGGMDRLCIMMIFRKKLNQRKRMNLIKVLMTINIILKTFSLHRCK